jgi:hypothetical protein
VVDTIKILRLLRRQGFSSREAVFRTGSYRGDLRARRRLADLLMKDGNPDGETLDLSLISGRPVHAHQIPCKAEPTDVALLVAKLTGLYRVGIVTCPNCGGG